MHTIRRVLAALRSLILSNSLIRASLRGLLSLLLLLTRATKRRPPIAPNNAPNDSQNISKNIRIVYPEPDDTRECYPERERNVICASASLIPASLHPYLHAGPSAFRSSQYITQLPSQESYSLRSLSVRPLPAIPSTSHPNPPPDTPSVHHFPAPLPSSHTDQGDYLPSTNPSVIDFHITAPLVPSASRSSEDITQLSPRESYPLGSLPVRPLPATPFASRPNPPPDTLSVHHSPALPPSPPTGQGGYLPSTNTSIIDFHIAPPTESSTQSQSDLIFDVMVSGSPFLSVAHPQIFPGTPESLGRYTRRGKVPGFKPTQFTIPALTISLIPNPSPPGWTTCLHPEGAQYFFHEEKRVFTDANLFDSSLLLFIEEHLRTILDFFRAHNVESNFDLVLDEYIYSDGSRGCQYYFVNHVGRSISWIDNAESEMFAVSSELPGMTSASHIWHELEAQYWYHCELFPRSLQLTHEIVDELRDIVLHAFGDRITAETSTVSWKADELSHMVQLVDGFDRSVEQNVDSKFSGASCIIGRLMHSFARARVYKFHGEPYARLDLRHSVPYPAPKRTMLMRVMNPLLFFAPDFHLNSLQKIYTDKIIQRRAEPQLITRLTSEWQEFTLYATVVLNANVAFLSIQSIDEDGILQARRSPQQISSYLSMLMSIGAIIIGLLLAKQNRDRDRLTAPDTAFEQTQRLETLAILYSLPFSMLIWSMVSFLAAFFFMCFDDVSLITRTLVGVLWGVVAAFILWYIFYRWEGNVRRVLGTLVGTFFWGEKDSTEDENSSNGDDNGQSTPAYSQPLNRWWGWLSIMWQKRPVDSERTVV